MIEDAYFFNTNRSANEIDCYWDSDRKRRVLVARCSGPGVRVADCYVAEGCDEDAAKQMFKDILILRGVWHGPV